MPGYRVRFLRTVSNDTGHEAKVCQALLDVEAGSEDHAISRAKEAICSGGVSPWSLACFDPDVVPLDSVATAQTSPKHHSPEIGMRLALTLSV